MTQRKLGRYDLVRVLGKGAMGLVYEGRDPNLDRRVAIKTIKVENLSEQAAVEYEARFRTEARSAARLQHPNIVSVYDSDRDGDIAFLVMEFIQGEDLKHHLDQGKRHTLEQTLAVMADLLSALEYAHRAKIVHRDIKPANLLIEASGRVKLTDFGVARMQDSGDATRTQGSMVGTLKYMSPEQVQGQPVDGRSDLFAAGVVLYQLLTGQRPFDGDSDFAIIQRIVAQDAPAPTSINPKLPPGIDAVMARALAKSRDHRYATAQEFAAALQACARQAADPTAVSPASVPELGRNSTWTGTMRAGESLVDTQSGTGAAVGASAVTQELELVYWKDIKDSTDAQDLQGFLARFPSGVYVDLARRQLRKLGFPTGEDSSSGSPTGSGVGTPVLPGAPAATDQTEVVPRESTGERVVPVSVPAQFQYPDRVDSAWDALGQVTGPASVSAPASGAPNAVPVAALHPPSSDVAALADGAESETAPAAPLSRRVVWALAGIVALASVGLGFKLLSDSAAPATQSAALAASAASSATTNATAISPASAPALAPAQAALPIAQASAARTVASAVLAVSAASAAAPGASAAVSAAARKAASDKDKLAKQAIAKTPAPAPVPEPVPTEHAVQPAKPAQAKQMVQAEPAHAPLASANPRQACEERSFISFQLCMAEQCAKPMFANQSVCVERRAMEQRRRDAEQTGR